ncbi:MAG: Gfo/Idh/MocA family oxidoreductase [Victivallales bacterium]|nr:Gfo/Idh/MocA family oxidoreductase [Victivallales bacterium]
MKLKFALVGLRHIHITTLYEHVKIHPMCQLVATCEEDPVARQNAQDNWNIKSTHDNFEEMLQDVDFDVLAVGDYYSKRGKLLIAALKAGKHVIADKPICTDMDELNEITSLAMTKNLKIGCMLDLRENANVVAAQQYIAAGNLGDIHSIQFGGQHPLMYGTRASWYFEQGKHGGTINDIAIHGLDLVEWITGHKIRYIIASRTWNAFADKCMHFNDAAQLMVTLDNDCGVMGDVSYFSPDSHGYKLPFYWRMIFWGRKGVMEFNYSDPGVKVALNGESQITELLPLNPSTNFLDSFLADVEGQAVSLNTVNILNISRKTMEVQRMADNASAPKQFLE